MELINEILASEAFIGAVVMIVGAIFTALANRATKALEARTGIQIEEKHAKALHEAVVTGVESAMRHGLEASVSTMRAYVVQHLKESVPEALTALTPGDGVVDRLIERYTLEALQRLAAEPK